jgi:hypothetical protein
MGELMPATSLWIVFTADRNGGWKQQLYIDSSDDLTGEPDFFFSHLRFDRFFGGGNFGDVAGGVYGSILSATYAYQEMMDELIGDEFLDLLLTAG